MNLLISGIDWCLLSESFPAKLGITVEANREPIRSSAIYSTVA